jgi:hypothetical protein
MPTYRIKSISGETKKAVIEVSGIPADQIEGEHFVVFRVATEYCTPGVLEDISQTVGELTRRGMLPAGKKALVLPEWIEVCEFADKE